jgi:pimeloyl-ACP methyl ester carboxylesterase
MLDMCATPHHVVASAFESVTAYDAAPALRALRMPVMNVSAEPPLADVNELRALCSRVVIERTNGAGHFHQLEAPEQVNALVTRFLDEVRVPSPEPRA